MKVNQHQLGTTTTKVLESESESALTFKQKESERETESLLEYINAQSAILFSNDKFLS